MNNLFRKEVMDKQGQRLFGDVVLASPISHKVMTGLLSAIIASFLAFVILGEYSRKERVTGYLTPNQGLIRLLPLQTGLIENIDVNVGDIVEKGDTLFTVKIDVVAGNGFSTAETLLTQLEAEKVELILRSELIPPQYNLTKDRLKNQIIAAKSEAQRVNVRIALQEKSIKNERDLLRRFQDLVLEDAASSLEASGQENRLIQASQALEGLLNEKHLAEDKATDMQSQYRLLTITEQQEISDINSRLIAVEQRVTQTQGQERYVIKAPISGKVASLTAKEGQIASPERAIGTLLPAGGKLEAVLLVPSRAAGFVKEGQNVRLLYDAFPYQKFGSHSGVVSKVSKTVINAADLPFASNAQDPVFIITINLKHQAVDVNNEFYELQSGMTLMADIILEDRKMWEWVFAPVLSAVKK